MAEVSFRPPLASRCVIAAGVLQVGEVCLDELVARSTQQLLLLLFQRLLRLSLLPRPLPPLPLVTLAVLAALALALPVLPLPSALPLEAFQRLTVASEADVPVVVGGRLEAREVVQCVHLLEHASVALAVVLQTMRGK